MGAAMPASFQNNNQLQLARSPKKTSAPIVAIRLSITKFEDGPPLRIWFGVYHSHSAKLTQLYLTFPADKRKYIDSTRHWTFDFCLYEHYVNQLQASEYDFVELVELPRFLAIGIKRYVATITKHQQQSSKLTDVEKEAVAGTGIGARISEEDSLNIETSLLDLLLPFQLEGIKYVVRHGGKALIGDDMGCGKTIQAIGVMQHYRNHWPVLMLVPVSMGYQWQSELLKFSGDLLKEREIFIAKKGTDSVSGKICIVPYSLLEKLVDNGRIRPEQFGVVVADESHNLKNKDAKRTNMALPFLKAATVSLCLTGTPATNRPVELFTQLNGLLPLVFNDYDQFTKRYCDAKPSQFGQKADVRGSSNEAELKLLMEGMVMIRRMKSAVLKNLPGKDRIVEYVSPDPAYVTEIKRMQSRMVVIDRSLRDQSDTEIVKELQTEQRILLTTLYNVTGMSKVESIKSVLLRLIQESRKEKEKAETADNLRIVNEIDMKRKHEILESEDHDKLMMTVEEMKEEKAEEEVEILQCGTAASYDEYMEVEHSAVPMSQDKKEDFTTNMTDGNKDEKENEKAKDKKRNERIERTKEVKIEEIEAKEEKDSNGVDEQLVPKNKMKKRLKRRYSDVKGSYVCSDPKAVLMCLEYEGDEPDQTVGEKISDNSTDTRGSIMKDFSGTTTHENSDLLFLLDVLNKKNEEKVGVEEREEELEFFEAKNNSISNPLINSSVPHHNVPTPTGPFTTIRTIQKGKC